MIAPRIVQDRIPTPAMCCDHTGYRCLAEVRRAPILVIPSTTPYEPGHRPIRIPTPLHYCDMHRGGFEVQTYLSGEQKTRIEAAARMIRPDDFKPDFDTAFGDLVLVTTPEYRRFLVHIGSVRHAA
jgi:hypothetical protein